jgi:hypothetical protein
MKKKGTARRAQLLASCAFLALTTIPVHACVVPLVCTFAGHTVDGTMTAKSGKPCRIRLQWCTTHAAANKEGPGEDASATLNALGRPEGANLTGPWRAGHGGAPCKRRAPGRIGRGSRPMPTGNLGRQAGSD